MSAPFQLALSPARSVRRAIRYRQAVAVDVALDPNRTALLVVDMQNDFCTPGGFFEQVGLDISPGERIVEPIARLLETARSLGVHVVFTRSMRPDPQPQR